MAECQEVKKKTSSPLLNITCFLLILKCKAKEYVKRHKDRITADFFFSFKLKKCFVRQLNTNNHNNSSRHIYVPFLLHRYRAPFDFCSVEFDSLRLAAHMCECAAQTHSWLCPISVTAQSYPGSLQYTHYLLLENMKMNKTGSLDKQR